jgi:uncharacterized secreted protein with C-terminal beta-propeller domain
MTRARFDQSPRPLRPHAQGRRFAGSLERLEARELMAASLNHGLWVVPGDLDRAAVDDNIVIDRDPAAPTMLRAVVNGVVIDSQVDAAVRKIRVVAGRGNDTVRIDEQLGAITQPTMIVAGSGHDLVEGGSSAERLFGGSGRDTLHGGGGGDAIFGGAGGDHVDGGPGADSVDGGSGRDELWTTPEDTAATSPRRAGRLAAPAETDDVFVTPPIGDPDREPQGIAIGGGPIDPPNDQPVAAIDPIDVGRLIAPPVVDPNIVDDPIIIDDIIDAVAIELWRPADATTHPVDAARIGHDLAPTPIGALDGLKQLLIDAAIEQWQGTLGTSFDQGGWCCVWYADDAAIDFDGGNDIAIDVAFDLAAREPVVVHFGVAMPAIEAAGNPDFAATVMNDRGGAAGLPSFSTTNSQEAGVNEADIIKTDGGYLYILAGRELIIVDAWPAEDMHVVSRDEVEGTPVALYLEGDRVTVISRVVSDYRTEQLDTARQSLVLQSVVLDPYRGPVGRHQSKITVFDVADRTSPQVLQETYLDGRYEDSRAIGDRAYIVLRNSLPELPSPTYQCSPIDPPTPPADTTADYAASISRYPYAPTEHCTYEDESAYRDRLAAVPFDAVPEYLTRVATDGGIAETAGELLDRGLAYAAFNSRGDDLVTVVMIDAGGIRVGPPVTTSVVGSKSIVYGSAENLYVVTSNSSGWSYRSWSSGESSQVFKIALGNDGVTLAAAGEVPGSALNQFSMDEEDGRFRIVTTSGGGWGWNSGGFTNQLFVMEQAGDQLNVVGSLEGFAPDERVYSARFIGDRAYVVTFRNTDPLFTFDLSDPTAPKLVGELVIPGFSTYLHPYDEGHLIALGRHVDWNEPLALQLAMFDVTDLANPLRTHVYSFGTNQWGEFWSEGSEAERDHHAFSFFSGYDVLAMPVSHGAWFGEYSSSPAGLEVLDVSLDEGFTMLGRIEHHTDVRRSLRIGDMLYSVSSDQVKAQPLRDPAATVARVVLT